MISTRAILIPLAAIVALATCGGGNDENPTPGSLVVQVTSTTSADGAILLMIQGSKITNVHASRGTIQTAVIDNTHVKVLLLGSLGSGNLIEFDVPNPGKVANYTATIEQVAARSNSYALLQPADFPLQVVRAP
jgi:hypothetical protein